MIDALGHFVNARRGLPHLPDAVSKACQKDGGQPIPIEYLCAEKQQQDRRAECDAKSRNQVDPSELCYDTAAATVE